MSRTLYIFTAILFIALAFSCDSEGFKPESVTGTQDGDMENYTEEKVTAKEFIEWCADKEHKLNKTKEISDIRYHLSYLPPQVMAYLELRNQDFSYEQLQRTAKNYSEMTYFNFKIEAPEGKGELLKYRLRSPSQYEDRVNYLSFMIEKDIYLIQGNDSIHPGLFHFERIFEVAPYTIVMFAFDNNRFNKDQEFTIVYNDRLFEKGALKYNYKNNQLINLPNISGL